jgi:hypothetical protein
MDPTVVALVWGSATGLVIAFVLAKLHSLVRRLVWGRDESISTTDGSVRSNPLPSSPPPPLPSSPSPPTPAKSVWEEAAEAPGAAADSPDEPYVSVRSLRATREEAAESPDVQPPLPIRSLRTSPTPLHLAEVMVPSTTLSILIKDREERSACDSASNN